eukprot:4890724-Lingulodinium_polyedra.AAC.1
MRGASAPTRTTASCELASPRHRPPWRPQRLQTLLRTPGCPRRRPPREGGPVLAFNERARVGPADPLAART